MRDNLDHLRDALRADAAGVARALLGEPNATASTKHTLRWGSKGSLSVEVAGSKKGFWFSHESGEGSDLLGLIRHVKACQFPDAIEWAARYTGIAADDDDWQPQATRPIGPSQEQLAARAAEAAEAEADEASRIALAGQIASACIPLAGTPGERYLKQVRGIPAPATGWPDAIRWHPAYRAVVAVATAEDGSVRAVQRVHLGEDGEKVGADEMTARRLRAVKVTNGVTIGAAVRLPGDSAGPVLIAEGPETGLSVYTSTGHETWVALGSLSKLALPAGRSIVVCRDDDARHSPADTAHGKAVSGWRAAKHHVVVATPWPVRRGNKSDLADVVLAEGPPAVKARIEAALSRIATTKPIVRLPVDEAREIGRKAIAEFFGQADRRSEEKIAWDKQVAAAMAGKKVTSSDLRASIGTGTLPLISEEKSEANDRSDWGEALSGPIAEWTSINFTHGVRIDVGVGKSHEARMQIARLLIDMRARGDTRNVVLAVPMHALGDEQAATFLAIQAVRDAGLRVAVWRGRSAPDPDHADYRDASISRDAKTKMCGDIERVDDAQAVCLQAQTSVCARRVKQADGKNKTIYCPLFHGCSYQRQQQGEADLWIMSHDMLFHRKPEAMGEIAVVVVDESVWRKGLIGAEGKPVTLSLDTFGQDCTIYVRKTGLKDRAGTERLADLRRQLLTLSDTLSQGPLQRDALAGSILTPASCVEAVGLEYERIMDPLNPGQSKKERREAMARAEGNKTVKRMAMVWEALCAMLQHNAPTASGWLALDTEATVDGPVRVVRIKGRSEVSKGWKAPTLLLDALLPVELVKPFWPDLELVADVKAAMPHQYVHQVIDRAYSLSMLEPLNETRAKADPEEAKRRCNRMRDVRAMLVAKAQHYAPREILVVLQQSIEVELRRLGRLPSNMHTAHHNNIAGRDEWKHVAAVIVVGRTLPPPSAVEQISEAITGAAGTPLGDWYERADSSREMADGSTLPAEAESHTSPLAETIRWQIAEGELLQIAGRGRGVNRTAENPLDVLLMTDAPLPIPLAGTLGSADLDPGPVELMMSAGGMVLENPGDAAAAYPALWPNREAAKKAHQRGKLGTFPYRDIYIGECPQLRSFAYKAIGQGKSAAKGGYDPDLCPDPEAFIRCALGSLAWFRIDGEGGEPEPPKPGRKRKADQPGAEPAAGFSGEADVPLGLDETPEPPTGHPASEQAPVEDWGWWQPAYYDDSVPMSEGIGIKAIPSDDGVSGTVEGPNDADREKTTTDLGEHTLKRQEFLPNIATFSNPDADDDDDPLVCDVPWLHADAPAFQADDGAVLLPACPYCGGQHRHGGFGHRLAHCHRSAGRGYVLREVRPPPADSRSGWSLGP